jgi:hypothetical protein
MMKYLEAAAAAAIDLREQESERRNAALLNNIEKFMTAELAPDPDPSQVADSLHRIGQGKIEKRVQCFAIVRSFLSKNPPSGLDCTFEKFEKPLFEQIAYFEAVACEYHESGPLEIDDERFNRSLEMLTALNDMDISARSMSLITEYYKGMDWLLAEVFYRTHNRGNPLVRIGPFSCSTGVSHGEIERSALVLGLKEKSSFVTQVWKELSWKPINPDSWLYRRIAENVSNEPKSGWFWARE